MLTRTATSVVLVLGLAAPATAIATADAAGAATAATAATAVMAEPTAGPGWHAVPTPTLQAGAALYQVAPANRRLAWAVGTQNQDKASVLLRWNGHAWAEERLPDTPGAGLFTVAAAGPRRAWAGGGKSPDGKGYAIHWNGRAWRRVGVPDGLQITKIAASRGGAAWALASDSLSTSVLRYDKHQWVRADVPLPAHASPWAIAVRNARDVWITGSASDLPFALHWDGTQWQNVAVPGGYYEVITQILPLGPDNVWAYSDDTYMNVSATLLHWDGTTWTKSQPGVQLGASSQLTDDGEGGFWLSYYGGLGHSRYLRYQSGGFTDALGPDRTDTFVDTLDIARVPGTRTVWSVGRARDYSGANGPNQAVIERFN